MAYELDRPLIFDNFKEVMIELRLTELNLITSLAFHRSFQWYYCQREQATQRARR
jgi:hypothetical protein